MKKKLVSEGTLITTRVHWWHYFICYLFGHKKIPLNFCNKFFFQLEGENFLFKDEFLLCERCGMYCIREKIKKIPLTEDEKMIKDLIE